MKWDDWLVSGVAGAGACFFLFAVMQCVYLASAERVCLAAGYPVTKIDYAFNEYCVKRVNQTDVVVPVAEIPK